MLRFRNELAVGELHDQLPALVFGAQSLRRIAIRLLHLLVMDAADLLLRFGGLLHRRIEQDEILVFGFGLRQAVRAAFAIPAIGDGQLGLGQELALIVGVDQRVQRDAGDFVAAVLDVVDRFVEQHLVGLLGVFRDRVFVFLAAETAGGEQAPQQRSSYK